MDTTWLWAHAAFRRCIWPFLQYFGLEMDDYYAKSVSHQAGYHGLTHFCKCYRTIVIALYSSRINQLIGPLLFVPILLLLI